MQPLALHHIGQRQQQRRVRVRPDRDPLEPRPRLQIVPDRADIDEPAPPRRHPPQRARHPVLRRPPGPHLGILRRHTPQTHEQRGMLLQHRPTRMDRHQLVHRRHDMRHQHPRRGQAVAVLMADIPADRVQKPMDLALRMMKPPRRRPPVGPTEDRPIAMRRLHPPQLPRHQIERFAPRDLDESLAPPSLPLAPLQPPHPHRRPADPAPLQLRRQHMQPDRRRIRVALERMQRNRLVPLHLHLVNTPVARREYRHIMFPITCCPG